MSDKKPWYDIHDDPQASVVIETDPQGDAEKHIEKNKGINKGVTRVGGGDHGKVEKGVKRVSRG